MTSVELFTDILKPFGSNTTVSLYSTAIPSSSTPTANDVLKATSGTTAEWLSGANALKTTGADVDVGSSSAPTTGQILLSTGATTAVWSNPTSNPEPKSPVRVATTTNGTLASDFENGDTIDGITLSTGDRILIKDQTVPVENGIYTVNVSGAPTRATDYSAGLSASHTFLFITEGTRNANLGFICTNNPPNDVVGTDSLTFSVYASAGSSLVINNADALRRAVLAGIPNIILAPGTYDFSTSLVFPSDVSIKGSGRGSTIIRTTATSFNMFSIGSISNITISDLTFNRNSQDAVLISANSTTNLIIKNCAVLNSSGTSNSLDFTSVNDSIIDSCFFDNCTADADISIAGSNGRTLINKCIFNNRTGNRYVVLSQTNVGVVINACTFANSTGNAININSPTSITNCTFDTILLFPFLIGVNSDGTIIANNAITNSGNINIQAPIVLSGNHISTSTTNAITLGSVSANNTVISSNRIIGASGDEISINVAVTSALITKNSFAGRTSFTNSFVGLTTSNTFVQIQNNDAVYTVTTTNGTQNANGDASMYAITTSGVGTNTISLQDLPIGCMNHRCVFVYAGGTQTLDITPVSTVGYLGTTYTSVQLAFATADCSFIWTGFAWRILSVGNGTLIP